MPAILVILVLVLGGGASVASEQATPGSLLYPVKVNINEGVIGALSFSAKAKANWDVRVTERRLEEAEELSAEGKLDADARAQIEENFAAHADRVHERISDFQARSDFNAAADVAANFATSLRVHQTILERLALENSSQAVEVNHIVVKVREQELVTAKERTKAEASASSQASPDVQAAAEGRMGAAQNKISEVRAFLNRMKTSLTASAVANAEAQLAVADKLFADGKVKLDAKAYAEAFTLFGKAHEAAQAVKLMLDSSERLDLDIRVDTKMDVETRTTNSAGVKVDASVKIGL
ncbi:MAG: DUF5667 domain-containing protein [bacterium]|nr:DUF5667 domain-containing protein [bacterium]